MARGGFPGGGGLGGKNLNKMLKQAQKMQEDMKKAQEELGGKTVEASSGGGAVKVVATGNKEIKEIIIDPDVVDPDDVEMLQDLVLAAVNSALLKANELADEELGRISGGMGLPGMF